MCRKYFSPYIEESHVHIHYHVSSRGITSKRSFFNVFSLRILHAFFLPFIEDPIYIYVSAFIITCHHAESRASTLARFQRQLVKKTRQARQIHGQEKLHKERV